MSVEYTPTEKKIREVYKLIPQHDKKLFPSTNQTAFCWQKYNEFVLVEQYLKHNPTNDSQLDEDLVKVAKTLAKNTCPLEWVSDWDDQRTKGNFPGLQPFKHGHPLADGAVKWGPGHAFWNPAEQK